jgi:hypothetical protein
MIDLDSAIQLASKALREGARGDCTAQEASHDAGKNRWIIHFRPSIPGLADSDVVDDGPVVVVDSSTGQTQIVDLMAGPPG